MGESKVWTYWNNESAANKIYFTIVVHLAQKSCEIYISFAQLALLYRYLFYLFLMQAILIV